jgi:hypothetical protein
MLSFLSKNVVLVLVGSLLGFSAGYITKDKIFSTRCPDLRCPECPPSNITNLIINNEKIKTKGGGNIDLSSILSGNTIVQKTDSTTKTDSSTRKKGFLRRIFKK